jgi:hypothetical protein
MIETTEAIGPAHWASYIVNGDATGFDYYNTPNDKAGDKDKADCDKWLDELASDGWMVVSTKDDEEQWFSSFYFNSRGRRLGCDVITYILHKVTK